MKLLVGIGLALAAVSCKQEVAASVYCTVVEGDAAECTVTRTKGDADFEVCWDFKVVCQNNATLEAPTACAKVHGNGETKQTTPKDKLSIRGECDVVKEASVTNMTIDGKAAQRPSPPPIKP